MVYVISKNGQPLMPTERHGKIRRLLKAKKAIVIRRCPFTVKLLYDTTEHTQPVVLGVDAGSKHIGLSATTQSKVLFEADVELRNDITNLISTRREARKIRRYNKTRYRKPRFNNRIKAKKNDWLAPSIRQKINTHLVIIEKIHKILPVSKIIIETASFDIQKIKNHDITGTEYQQGEQLAFWNVREYVLFRDNHVCQCCKGKSRDKILNVHHIESRKTGGNSPNNLITLCETCHTGYHKGSVKLPKNIKRGMSFRDAAFMGIMRWALYNKLKEIYPNVYMTYGYITKNTRISNHLPKEHYIDARCISNNPLAVSDNSYYYIKKTRCHNRQIHKSNKLKGGILKRNQADYTVKSFRLFDKVSYLNNEYFIFGRRATGYFDIRTLSGEKVNKGSISYKKLKLIEKSKHYLIERRKAHSSPTLEVGILC